MARTDELESFQPKNRGQWRGWLEKKHDTSPGVWLVVGKKNSEKPGITYDEAVEEGLSYGWIDGRARTRDGDTYVLLMTPRKPGSVWAKSNKLRVERLIANGSMTGAGLAKVEAAKKEGSWSRLDDVEALKIPDDLQRALDADSEARKNFDSFSDSSKKMILGWILDAKRPETRSKRISETVSQASLNRKSR